jgi:hypothetical protein
MQVFALCVHYELPVVQPNDDACRGAGVYLPTVPSACDGLPRQAKSVSAVDTAGRAFDLGRAINARSSAVGALDRYGLLRRLQPCGPDANSYVQ